MKRTALPSREELLAFIRERSGKVGTREIARAFGAKNADRAALKRMLRELADEGHIERHRKRLHHPGTLPPSCSPTSPAAIATASCWRVPRNGTKRLTALRRSSASSTPRRRAGRSRRRRRPRAAAHRANQRRGNQRARHQADRSRQAPRARNFSRPAGRRRPPGADRQKAARPRTRYRERVIPVARRMAILSRSRWRAHGRLGLAAGSVVERLGSIKGERAVSLIAIHAHGIPHIFADAVVAEAEAARPPRLSAKDLREDWRAVPFVTIDPPDAKDHDDAVHAVPDPDPRNRGGHLVSIAIADVRITCGLAQRSIARRPSAAIRFIFPTASCRCCPSAFPTISARCGRTKTARRSPCAW
jgi:ribonuclease R